MPASTNRADGLLFVELAKALGWPLVALIVAIAFRQALTGFLGAIGGRVSKVSAFNVSIDLAAAKAPAATPLLDEIKSSTDQAQVSDSTRSMIEQAQSTVPADYAVIQLGTGDEWLTSRLYIAAVLMERMRGAKVLVFVERAAGVERRFVAVANIRQLRWQLATKYPWLESALVRALNAQMGGQDPRTAQMAWVTNDTGALEPYQAQNLVRQFVDQLQEKQLPPPTGLPVPPDWVQLPTYRERASWITHALLRQFIPDVAFNASITTRDDDTRVKRSRALLRCRSDFVAVVGEDGRFLSLLNRDKYLEEVAAHVGEEQEKTQA